MNRSATATSAAIMPANNHKQIKNKNKKNQEL